MRSAERNAAASAEVVIGDCAYGDGQTRRDFADDGYDLFARLPGRPRSDYFLKQDFAIDLGEMACTCPAGQTTTDYRPSRPRRKWKTRRAGVFHFGPEQCGPCPLRERCYRSQTKPTRRISVHPQEALLKRARVRQQSPEGRALGRLRTRIEHRLARLCQLGIRQSRMFFGRERTLFQLLMAAAVANLTLAEGIGKQRAPLPPVRDPEPSPAEMEAPCREHEQLGLATQAADAGLAMTANDRAGSDDPGHGQVKASAADFGHRSGSGAKTGIGEYLRPIAGPARNRAVAIAAIAVTVRKSCARGRQGTLRRLEGLQGDFGAVANLFATRCPNWASRPGPRRRNRARDLLDYRTRRPTNYAGKAPGTIKGFGNRFQAVQVLLALGPGGGKRRAIHAARTSCSSLRIRESCSLSDGMPPYPRCLISRRWNRTNDRPISTMESAANTAASPQSMPLMSGSLPR